MIQKYECSMKRVLSISSYVDQSVRQSVLNVSAFLESYMIIMRSVSEAYLEPNRT